MTAHSPRQADGILRFLTCGSVDDGKSTLIGRLLYDTKLLFEDQLATLKSDTERFGTTGDEFDFALLVDGLTAEREQGITIDVAYRFFATERRRFIVADTPGHVQYTRNMATGASTAELAVLLVDARAGVITQTRRHAHIVSLLGIRNVVLAINKIDLVDFSEARFAEVRDEFQAITSDLGFTSVTAIPLSARFGDNVSTPSTRTPWYAGSTLLDYLETVEIDDRGAAAPFRLPVQWVNRPDSGFRGYTGTIAAGTVRPGDELVVPRTGQTTQVARIVESGGDRDAARSGDAVTLTTTSEIDISRGDILAAPTAAPEVSDQISVHLIWMSETELLPGRPYLLKAGGQNATATVSELKHRIDADTFQPLAAKTLGLNDIGLCNLSLSQPISFDAYDANRTTGSFILVDRFTNETVAAGMIIFGLRRATNIHWQALDVDQQLRADMLGQRPCILWFTGLSGSGKSTIANLVEKKLQAAGRHTYLLDGDNVRHGLNRDLGFTDVDRVENIRRIGETARLFVDAGLIVLTSFISPFRAERVMARGLVADDEFLEVFVDAPLEVVEARDPKGLYKKARAGEIANFTGIDSPYETPVSAEIHLRTDQAGAEELADRVVEQLRARGYLGRG
ncbi:MAG: sulfate adenylyltransferase subunit CysN [Alphaproteobacteria bacterium]